MVFMHIMYILVSYYLFYLFTIRINFLREIYCRMEKSIQTWSFNA